MRQFIYVISALTFLFVSADAGIAKERKKVKRGETVGSQTMTGDSKLSNKGTINGGNKPGVESNTPGSKTITNRGTISGSTGIKITGGGSVTITNRGNITSGP